MGQCGGRLRKAVADLTLDKLILSEAPRGSFFSIRGSWLSSGYLELIGRGLAGAAVLQNFKADLLAFNKAAQTRTFHGGDMSQDSFQSRRQEPQPLF